MYIIPYRIEYLPLFPCRFFGYESVIPLGVFENDSSEQAVLRVSKQLLSTLFAFSSSELVSYHL